jgi:hypothetical protein
MVQQGWGPGTNAARVVQSCGGPVRGASKAPARPTPHARPTCSQGARRSCRGGPAGGGWWLRGGAAGERRVRQCAISGAAGAWARSLQPLAPCPLTWVTDVMMVVCAGVGGVQWTGGGPQVRLEPRVEGGPAMRPLAHSIDPRAPRALRALRHPGRRLASPRARTSMPPPCVPMEVNTVAGLPTRLPLAPGGRGDAGGGNGGGLWAGAGLVARLGGSSSGYGSALLRGWSPQAPAPARRSQWPPVASKKAFIWAAIMPGRWGGWGGGGWGSWVAKEG